jgi:glycosyltransferase involved in cell wall biosynthesis
MRCTILHTIETGGPGGAESVMLALASRVDSRRFRSIALVPYEGWLSQSLEAQGVPFVVAKSRAWYDFTLPNAMAQVIRRERVDLIHSHLPDQNFYSCLVGHMTRTKKVVTYHGAPRLQGAGKLRSSIKLWVVRSSADAVVVVSDYLKQVLIDSRFPADRIVRIHNGVDVDRFITSNSRRLRGELQCRNGTKLIGMVANVREAKGYEYFVQAARKVADSVPHTKFLAIGEIDPTIGKRLQDLIGQLSLQDRFLLLGFRQDVPSILSELDIFVLSSVSEGFSLATVEAMAASKPVVVTRSGGPQEIIEDGRTGILVPPADTDALAAEICELLRNPDRADDLALSARAKVRTTFSLDAMVRQYERVYDRVLGVG